MQTGAFYADLTSLELRATLDGGPFSFPKIIAGEAITLKLKLSREAEGTPALVNRTVHSLKASLGRVDQRPELGAFKLHLGTNTADSTNTTAALPFNISANEFANALNALTDASLAAFLPCTVASDNASLIIRFKDAAGPVNIACTDNTLRPVAFVDLNVVSFDGGTLHEIRLVEAPVAQAVTFANIVPDPPVITTLRNGGNSGDQTWNEVQRIAIPADFTGAFNFKRGYQRSVPIAIPTSGTEIAAALKPLADIGGVFLITEEQDSALIEFQKSMGGINQDAIEIEVFDAPDGVLTFTLNTNTAEMWALLRRANQNNELKLTLQIELMLVDEQSGTTYRAFIFNTPLTLTAPVDRSAQNIAAALVWNQPPSKTRYIPFSSDELLIGHRSYRALVGDGSATSFVVNHNLGTDNVRCSVRVNASGGRELINGTDYTLVYTNTNSATITFTVAPSASAIAVTIEGTEQPATYQAHTHPIGEITGLQSLLDAQSTSIATLNTIVGITGGSAPNAQIETPAILAQWTLPAVFELYPWRGPQITSPKSLGEIDLTKLPRSRGLLAAVHDAASEALTVPLPVADAAFIGRVFENTSGNTVILPGILGHKSIALLAGEFAACDGRLWYRVTKQAADSATSSWYPTDFDRTLFEFAVNDKQLALNRTLELQLGIELGILHSNSRAQWMLVIEHGAFTADATPGTPAPNLAAVTWTATPILTQRIMLEPMACVHSFGITIARKIVIISGTPTDSLVATQIAYGTTSGGGSAPASANFALRARLIRFDTENSVTDPRGFAAILGLDKTSGTAPETLGKAIIKSS